MKNPILMGNCETIETIKLDTVWLDRAGAIGVVSAVSSEGFIIQIGDSLFQNVPMEHLKQFKETVECLGEL